jgi:hypothetical protein
MNKLSPSEKQKSNFLVLLNGIIKNELFKYQRVGDVLDFKLNVLVNWDNFEYENLTEDEYKDFLFRIDKEVTKLKENR